MSAVNWHDCPSWSRLADGDSCLVHIDHEQREGVTGPTKKHDMIRGDRVGDPPLTPFTLQPPATGSAFVFTDSTERSVLASGSLVANAPTNSPRTSLGKIVGAQLAADLVKRLAD